MRVMITLMAVAGACMSFSALALVGCGGGNGTETPASPHWAATLAAAQQEAADDGKRVAVVFYLADAPAVQVLFDESIPHRAVRAYYDRYVWVRLSFDRETDISRQYRIYVAPTILILEPSGQEVTRYEKFMDGPEMADFLSQYVGP
jgi:hypothetical protein